MTSALSKIDILQDDFHTKLRIFFKTHDNSYKSIIHTYRDLKIPKYQTKKIPIIIPLYKRGDSHWQYQTIDTIQEVFNSELVPYIDNFIIHGSFASNDFIENWSDLDAIIILNDKVFRDENVLSKIKDKINRLSMLCYKIDPLAHHLFSFITSFDLLYYPKYFFPPELLKHAVSLSIKNKMNFYARHDFDQKNNKAYDFLTRFKERAINSNTTFTPYSWKNIISQGLLWPSICLQLCNIYVYKRESFDLFKKTFLGIDCFALDELSEHRRSWKRINLLRFIPDKVILVMGPRLFTKIVLIHNLLTSPRFSDKKQQQIKQLLKRFVSLMEKSYDESKVF